MEILFMELSRMGWDDEELRSQTSLSHKELCYAGVINRQHIMT